MRSIMSLGLAAIMLAAMPASAQLSVPEPALEPLPPQPEPPAAKPEPPAPAPEPPAPPPAPGPQAGVIETINLASLKALAESQGADAKIATDGGLSYVHATVGGNVLFLVPQDCRNGDPKDQCNIVILGSGTWKSKIQLSKLMEFQRQPMFSQIMTAPAGQPMLRYVFFVKPGVASGYLETVYAQFNKEMMAFAQWAAGGGKGTFSAEAPVPSLVTETGLGYLGNPVTVD